MRTYGSHHIAIEPHDDLADSVTVFEDGRVTIDWAADFDLTLEGDALTIATKLSELALTIMRQRVELSGGRLFAPEPIPDALDHITEARRAIERSRAAS